MLTVLEKQPSPSPLPRIKAPPGTPTSELPKSESQPQTQDEIDQRPHFSATQEPSQPGTPDSTSPSRRKRPRKKGRFSHRLGALSARFKPTLILENSGSVARDHLASERTFLAYVRTSLLVASTGVALVQLFAVSATSPSSSSSATLMRVHQFARPLGATLILFGFVILVQGVRRYFMIQTLLTKGFFPASRFAVIGITLVLAIVVLIIFAVLVSARN